MFKKIALVAAGSAIAIPITVTQIRSSNSLKDLLGEEHTVADDGIVRIDKNKQKDPFTKITTPVDRRKTLEEVISSIEKSGYTKKSTDKLVDFDKDRSIEIGQNTGLGCFNLLFKGVNYPRLKDPDTAPAHASFNPAYSLYIGRDWDTPVACSTAALRNNQGKKLYEFEFAFKRDDGGFVEKIFVEQERIYSQVVFYKEQSTGAFKHVEALQRRITKNATNSWTIANPTSNETWTDLDLDKEVSTDQPIYYAVWTGENPEKGNIFQNLGIKSKSDGKWFSAVVPENKTQNEEKKLEYFSTRGEQTVYFANSSTYLNYGYAKDVANTLDKTKGSWKKIEDFCRGYEESDTNRKINNEEKTRLREYCFRSNKADS